MALITGDERDARYALAILTLPEDPVTERLIARFGAVETLDLLVGTDPIPGIDKVAGDLWRHKGMTTRTMSAIERTQRDSERLGLRVIVPGDREWPAAFTNLGERAPLVLWTKGNTDLLGKQENGVTITGAWALTAYGEHVTSEMAGVLAAIGRTIIAGGAYGVDAAAHRATLGVDGSTVAVLAGGLDRPYPAGNADLLDRIGERGLLVPEVAPGSTLTRQRFLARNRIMAALSGATVIAEVSPRSGALNVAARATDLGRPVGAVPGPVTSANSAGTHQLIREGRARLVTDAADIQTLMGSPNGQLMCVGFDQVVRSRLSTPPKGMSL